MSGAPDLDPRTLALIDLLRRCGSSTFRIEHTDEDNPPIVWVAVAEFAWMGDGVFEAAAAPDPYRAVYRLAEQCVDGGTCAHCRRPTGVLDEFDDPTQRMPGVCWYVYDPELDTMRRGCEGST